VDVSIDWGWLADHVGAMGERFLQHFQLVVIAVAVGRRAAAPRGWERAEISA